MKLTFTQFAAAAILASASAGALASPVAWNGSFALYAPTQEAIDGSNDVTGYIDTAVGTWSVASTTLFLDIPWTASGGTLYGPGTYTVIVNGEVSMRSVGTAFTAGAGQVGGNIDVSRNQNNGIDVFQVWDVLPPRRLSVSQETPWRTIQACRRRLVQGRVQCFLGVTLINSPPRKSRGPAP
jgi:hypothetical protein